MNLYFFGGSFDPPHLGHKEIINHFIDQSDILIVCPSYKSPLKHDAPIASFLHRKEMLEMMFPDNEKLSIIDYEINNKIKFNLLYDKNRSLQKKIKLEQLRKEVS